ncbi:HAD-like domain-containing protein [Baffinella frigidus]|nr:HAD-like domain-containing protein [Cryptophyta sp. CCMP2293]
MRKEAEELALQRPGGAAPLAPRNEGLESVVDGANAQQNYQSYAGQGMNDSRDSGTMSSQGGSYAPVGLIAQVDRNGKHTVTGAPVMGNNGYGAAALEAQESCAPLTGPEPPKAQQPFLFRLLACKCFSPPVPDEISLNNSVSPYPGSLSPNEIGPPLLPPKRTHHKVTLILDLDETLVHSSFKPVPNSDWIVPVEVDGIVHRVFVCKRPGLDYFMHRVAELFEVVVFTASLDKYANPVLDLLERAAPNTVHHRLFREACVFTHGALVKDLTRVPENAIPISSWFDELDDTQLPLLLPWLERLSYQDDVVPLLRELQMEIAQCSGYLMEVNPGGNGPPGASNVPSPLAYSISDGDVYPRLDA